jgi:DNA-binding CsgD family transcriptional regulator
MTPRPEAEIDPAANEPDASAPSAVDAELPRVFGTAAPTVMALVVSACIASDLVSDVFDGAPAAHMIGMAVGGVLSIVALVVMWRLMGATRAQARALQVALDSTRVDLQQWRSKSAEMMQGLGALIDRQFADWSLSSAEREVALLLLKGLSLKTIGEIRETSERTVRQQALAIYRKAGVAGRAELSAFFLEDLLLPRPDRGPGAVERRAAGATRA